MDFYRWVRTQWDRAGAVFAVLIGIVALLLGYQGTSDATLPTEQIPYLVSGGIFGLFALGIGATLWLSADLRDEWRKLDDIHAELRQRRAAPRPAPAPAPAVPAGEDTWH